MGGELDCIDNLARNVNSSSFAFINFFVFVKA